MLFRRNCCQTLFVSVLAPRKVTAGRSSRDAGGTPSTAVLDIDLTEMAQSTVRNGNAEEAEQFGSGDPVGAADAQDAAGELIMLGEFVGLGAAQAQCTCGGEQVDRGGQSTEF